MFGSRESFEYLECGRCKCLQLRNPPNDFSRFYPETYYSFETPTAVLDGYLVATIKKIRANLVLRAPRPVGEMLVSREHLPWFVGMLSGLGGSTSSPICDVGCGEGDVLLGLRRQGFTSLTGFDPFIDRNREIAPGTWLRKLSVTDMPGGWDVIMLNHSFEHMADPAAVLCELRTRLNPGGHIVIRIPVADSWAWRTYGTDWVQLDAPRHLFLHTQESMRVLTERAGLAIKHVFFDSYALQDWGSKQYQKGVSLSDPLSYAHDKATPLFTNDEIEEYEHRARALNRAQDGDSAGFILRSA